MRAEPGDLAQAVALALRWLRVRDYSCAEMAQRLRARGFSETVVNEALNWLIEERWLSDERLTQRLIARFCEEEPSGDARIRQEFERRGLVPPTELPLKETERALEALKQRFGTPPERSDARMRARWFRFLIQRGFEAETARSALQQWNPELSDDPFLSGG